MLLKLLNPSRFYSSSSSNLIFKHRIDDQFWTKIARLLKMDVHINEEGTEATVSLPGISYHDFDRSGHLNLRHMQAILTYARFMAYHTKNEKTGVAFLEYDKLTSDRFTFMASTKTEFSKNVYNITRGELPSLSLQVKIQLGHVGGSSLNSVAQMVNLSSDGEALITNTNQVVSVSKATRKPEALPDWWKTKYSPLSRNVGSLVISTVPVPAGVYEYEMKVPWSDIDRYKHVNYTAYIKYCQDAACDATHSGYYKELTGDFLDYNTKAFEAAYKGECLANDILVVKTWQSPDNPYKLQFSIHKKEAIIFQASFVMYSSE